MAASQTCRRAFAAWALSTSLVLGGSAQASAQLVASPESLSVTLAQGEEAARTVTLTNEGSEPLAFCLSFDRPLQRTGGGARLAEEAVGSACGALGEILLCTDQAALPGCCSDPYGLTMTPDGRLFAAENNGALTHELTPSLEVVRSFEHPLVDELDPFPATQGVTYNADTGTLWWLNVEQQGFDFRRAMLLEGDLDGVPTGRRIELPIATGDPPEEVQSFGVSYAPATARYYYVGTFLDGRSKIWAVDTLGAVAEGYPVGQNAYPGDSNLGFGPDAHGAANGEPEAVRLEMAVSLPNGDGFDRLVVVDSEGHDLHAETPLPDLSGGSGFGSIAGNPLRSRIDPSGVLYFAFVSFDTEGLVGIRPHPLPPSWLTVEAWDGTLEPGDSVEIALTFHPGERSLGDYTAVLQAFEAETGQAVEVPLSLAVTQGTDTEDEPAAAPTETSLAVYPNPSSGVATVAFTLAAATDARVAVYDVLGRRVALLHAGELTAGTHAFGLERQLPAGLYLVRAEGGNRTLTRRITLIR